MDAAVDACSVMLKWSKVALRGVLEMRMKHRRGRQMMN